MFGWKNALCCFNINYFIMFCFKSVKILLSFFELYKVNKLLFRFRNRIIKSGIRSLGICCFVVYQELFFIPEITPNSANSLNFILEHRYFFITALDRPVNRHTFLMDFFECLLCNWFAALARKDWVSILLLIIIFSMESLGINNFCLAIFFFIWKKFKIYSPHLSL